MSFKKLIDKIRDITALSIYILAAYIAVTIGALAAILLTYIIITYTS